MPPTSACRGIQSLSHNWAVKFADKDDLSARNIRHMIMATIIKNFILQHITPLKHLFTQLRTLSKIKFNPNILFNCLQIMLPYFI